MADYSLVPVDHEPEFENFSLVPVDHDPFAEDGVTQAPTQVAQAQPLQPQPMQPRPQSPPPLPPAGVNQPDVGAPADNETAPDGPQGGTGLDPGDAGSGSNPTSERSGTESAPFNGFANPTLTESLINHSKMEDQARAIDADRTGQMGSDFEAGLSYRFVTTKPALDPHQIGDTGLTFVVTSPFYAHDGSRTGVIDASPEHPLRVTVTSDNKLTIAPP